MQHTGRLLIVEELMNVVIDAAALRILRFQGDVLYLK